MAIRHSTVRRLDHQLSLLQEAGAAAVDLSTLARPMILQPAWLFTGFPVDAAHARTFPKSAMDKLRAYYLSSTGSKIKAAATISDNNDAVSYLSNPMPGSAERRLLLHRVDKLIVNAAVELNNFLNILLGTDCCMDSYRSIQRPKTNGMTEQSKAGNKDLTHIRGATLGMTDYHKLPGEFGGFYSSAARATHLLLPLLWQSLLFLLNSQLQFLEGITGGCFLGPG